jgi:hypothetical protein
VAEHEGDVVYVKDDTYSIIQASKDGRLNDPFAWVGFKDQNDDKVLGLACPVCVNVILGLGRG